MGDASFEVGEKGVHFGVGLLQIIDFTARVHNGRMVSAAQMAANLLKTVTSQIAGQIHTYLPRQSYRLAPSLALQIGQPNIEMVGNDVDNVADGDMTSRRFELAVKSGFCKLERYFPACGFRDCVNRGKCAFELPDIGLELSGDVVGNLLGDIHVPQVSLFLHDSDPRIVAGRVDSSDKAAIEPADKALFEAGDVGGGAVGTEDDLPAVLVERVEGVEKFLLALLSLAEELDVVDYEHIDGAELVLETREVALFDCADEFIDEFFAAQELNREIFIFVEAVPADGVEQMCFAEP